MNKKISHSQPESNPGYPVIECGTLEVFLKGMQHQQVLLMPLERTIPNGPQYARQWVVHLTAQLSPTAPVYYATFRAAEVTGLGQSLSLTYPYRFHGKEALVRAQALQQEMIDALHQELLHEPRVSEVVMPARYRLPDEWIWTVNSTSAHLIASEEHWVMSRADE